MIATDISQSRRLLAIGVPSDTADMVWLSNSESHHPWPLPATGCNKPIPEVGDIPAWSLSALLAVVPHKVVDRHSVYKFQLEWDTYGDEWDATYEMASGSICADIRECYGHSSDPIEACISLLEDMHENGYYPIKNN